MEYSLLKLYKIAAEKIQQNKNKNSFFKSKLFKGVASGLAVAGAHKLGFRGTHTTGLESGIAGLVGGIAGSQLL